MAAPNYGYEKRQKELAKKRKKEDKLKAKADRKTEPGSDYGQSGDSDADGSAAAPGNTTGAPLTGQP